MWHEARKQEKKIRQHIIDYRRRAERRQDFYEKIVSVSTLLFCFIFEPPAVCIKLYSRSNNASK